MPPPEFPSISAIRSSVIDGRMQNVHYRQRILLQLHESLLENYTVICDAIRKDSGFSESEAHVEYHCALQHIKSLFRERSLDFDQCLQDEYSVAKGVDFAAREVAIGLVLIRPIAYTRFYSIIAPLATAIASGNCVLLELETSLQTQGMDDHLKRQLPNALNFQAPVFTITPPGHKNESDIGIVEVLQDSNSKHSSTSGSRCTILRTPDADNKTIAIVDRTADLEEAARAILAARFNFQGKSPYAPDYVLVNEYVKKPFLHACMRHSIDKTDGPMANGEATQRSRAQRGGDASRQKLVDNAKSNSDTILLEGTRSTIIDVQDRDSDILKMKIREPILLVHSFSSLEDVLDHAAKMKSPLLASYIFSSLPVAKYLSQFLDTHVSCINQVPITLLVGPIAPKGSAVSLEQRYRSEMFCVPSPQYVTRTENALALAAALGSSTVDTKIPMLRSLALTPLPPIKQPDKNEVMGYFESALLTGIGAIVLPTVAAVGYLAYQGFWYASKRLRS